MTTTITTAGSLGSWHFPHLASARSHPTPAPAQLLLQEVAPRLRSLASSLSPVGAEDSEELAQDGLAIAAALLASSQARRKKVSAGNVCYYTAKLLRQGRRSTGASKTDVMHPGTQIAGRTQLVSLDAALIDEIPSEETLTLHDVLASKSEDPSMAAGRRLDWQRLSACLDPSTREVLGCLVKGEVLTTLVPKLRRSRSALQQDKHRLAKLVREHLGSDVLSQVQASPRWMDNITAKREKRECHHAERTF